MNKFFLPSSDRLVLAAVLSSIFIFTAVAQNAASTVVGPSTPAPAKGIGPAPANSKQNHILNSALSSDTLQTLQEAMNSYSATDTTHPKPKTK
jgi:hypothetical protein